MLLSVVIPAYNENKHIGATIETVRRAMSEARIAPYEIIVSDDDSTDGTGDIARSLGVTVVQSGKRNIAATRNVGAAAALGKYILFVDADTAINPQTLIEMMQAFEDGFIGGGTNVVWSEPMPMWYINGGLRLWNAISRIFRLPAGSFFFVTNEAFRQVGGFDEEFFVSEEIHLGKKLKRLGRLTILKTPIETSPRKAYQFTKSEYFRFFLKGIVNPGRTVRDREKLNIWYERRD